PRGGARLALDERPGDVGVRVLRPRRQRPPEGRARSLSARSRAVADPSRVRWRILLLIVAASFVSYLLRTNLSIVAPALMSELGMVLSAFALGYAIFQFPGGVFGDAVGPRRAVTGMAVAWGLLTLATGLVPGAAATGSAAVVAALIAIRFLVGVSHAPIFPV